MEIENGVWNQICDQQASDTILPIKDPDSEDQTLENTDISIKENNHLLIPPTGKSIAQKQSTLC